MYDFILIFTWEQLHVADLWGKMTRLLFLGCGNAKLQEIKDALKIPFLCFLKRFDNMHLDFF